MNEIPRLSQLASEMPKSVFSSRYNQIELQNTRVGLTKRALLIFTVAGLISAMVASLFFLVGAKAHLIPLATHTNPLFLKTFFGVIAGSAMVGGLASGSVFVAYDRFKANPARLKEKDAPVCDALFKQQIDESTVNIRMIDTALRRLDGKSNGFQETVELFLDPRNYSRLDKTTLEKNKAHFQGLINKVKEIRPGLDVGYAY